MNAHYSQHRGPLNRMASTAVACMAAFCGLAIISTPVSAASIKTLYSEDFSGFATGPLNDPGTDFGWDNGVADGVDVTGAFIVGGDDSDGSSANASLFSIPAAAKSVTVEFEMRARGSNGFQSLVSVQSPGGDDEIQFGSSAGSFRIRRDDGSNFFLSNLPVGNDDRLAGFHQWFDHRLTYDFIDDEGTWEVSRQVGSGGDGVFTTLTSFTSADIGTDLADPANWTGLSIRLSSTADQVDNFLVTASIIPEPGTFVLTVAGLFGVTSLRRRRRRAA